MTEVRIVWSTAPDAEQGAAIARRLVEEKLAACVNIVPGLRSVYRWQGQVEEDSEVLLIAKTRADRSAALCERLVALHPYDEPEVLVLPVAGGSPSYLDWVGAESAE